MDEKNLLISLGDKRIKQISEVLQNNTCSKILDYLAEKEGAVSDVSRDLKIPINTADYNIKKLVESGLIEKVSHFWSVRGKKMPVYRISNRKIIISPKKIKNSLSYIFALGLTALVALIIKKSSMKNEFVMTESFSVLTDTAKASFFSQLASWEYFLIGAWFSVLIFFLFSIISERRGKNG